MTPVDGSSGSSGSSFGDFYDSYRDRPDDEDTAAHAGGNQVPTIQVTNEDSGSSESHSEEVTEQRLRTNLDPRALAAGTSLGDNRTLRRIASNLDPRAMEAGQQIRRARSTPALQKEIERNIDPQVLRAGDLEGFRALRAKAKREMDQEAANRRAMGVTEMSSEDLRAQQRKNANFIAASSQAGPSGPFKGIRRAVQLQGAANQDSGMLLPGTSAVFEVGGKLAAKQIQRGLEKAKAGALELGSGTQKLANRTTRKLVKLVTPKDQGGPSGSKDTKEPKGPEGPKDEDRYDADDPKGKKKAREE